MQGLIHAWKFRKWFTVLDVLSFSQLSLSQIAAPPRVLDTLSQHVDFLPSNLLIVPYIGTLIIISYFHSHKADIAIFLHEYFWFKYDLGQRYHAPQVQPDRGLNS